ncbi:MAG: DNA repair protein RecO [Candidatus Saccharimonadales bacterium]
MQRYTTTGIVLARTDFGEADRILTFLTPDHGKVKAMAKGVRKSKAKLAGSIELFSVSDLTLIPGRSGIDTLISARLVKHYGNIVKDLGRTSLGFELLKMVNRAVEDAAEPAYFDLLRIGLEALDDKQIEQSLTDLWFRMQLLKLTGHSPNLDSDKSGAKLKISGTYSFHMDHMHFVPQLSDQGPYSAQHIKFLRLGFSAQRPKVLTRVSGVEALAGETQPLIQAMLNSYVRV